MRSILSINSPLATLFIRDDLLHEWGIVSIGIGWHVVSEGKRSVEKKKIPVLDLKTTQRPLPRIAHVNIAGSFPPHSAISWTRNISVSLGLDR